MREYRVTRLRDGDLELEMLHVLEQPAAPGGASFRDMTGIDPETDPKLAELVQSFAARVIESADDDNRYSD